MTWQQAAILMWLTIGGMLSIVSLVRDKELSSTSAFVAILIVLVTRVSAALVLASAGFW